MRNETKCVVSGTRYALHKDKNGRLATIIDYDMRNIL